MADEYVVDTDQANQQYGQRRSRAARNAVRAPGATARLITQRSGTYSGRGMLAGELLVAFAIVAIRLVGDYTLNEDGAVKGNVLHSAGHYGPFAIIVGLLGSFFLLSFLAMGGGTRAKMAVIIGGTIVLTLGIKSTPEIVKVGSTFGNVGHVTVPAPSGQLPNILGDPGVPGPASTGQAVLGGLSGVLGNNIQNITNSILSNPTTTSLGVEGGAAIQGVVGGVQGAAGAGQQGAQNIAQSVAGSNVGTNIGESVGGFLNNLGAGAKRFFGF